MKNCVYRFKNTSNEIIYIGRAKFLKSRLKGHKHLPKECYEEVSLIEYTLFDTEDDVDLAERYFISKIKPKYNTEFKGKNITVRIADFEEKEWMSYGETFIKNNNVNQIEILKLEDEMNLLSQKEKEIQSQIAAYNTILNKIKEQLGEFTFSFNENGKHIVFLRDDENKQKALSKELNQFYLVENIIEDARLALCETQRDLYAVKIAWVREVIGKEKLSSTDDFTIELFAKYEVFTVEEVVETGWNDLKGYYINEYLRQLYEQGYYFHTDLHMQVADSLELGPYLVNEGWKYLLYEINKEMKTINTVKYAYFFNKMIKEIEQEIESRVGKLRTDFMITKKIGYPGRGIEIDEAHLIKRI